MSDFNFDHWKNLAETSPAEFEKQRRNALMALVTAAPESQRAGLQALVDSLCAPTHATGLEKAVHAQNLMMESLVQLQQSLGNMLKGLGVSAPAPNAVQQFTELKVQKP